MSWWNKKENRPVLITAVIAGILSVLASLLGKAYLQQKELKKEATQAARQAEAATLTARQEANKGERAREQAQDLVGYIVKDLNDALIPVGQAEVLKSVALQALSYFENLPPDLVTPETDQQQATVWTTLANASHNLGDLNGSAQAHEKALTIWRRLFAGDPQRKTDLSHALNEFGIILIATRRIEDARNVYREVIALQPDSLGDLAGAEMGLAQVERANSNPEGALAHFAKACDLARSALKEEPEATLWWHTLGTSHNNAGLVAQNLEDHERAATNYLESLKATRKLVELQPDNRNWQKELATTLNNLGCLLDDQSDFSGAAPFFKEALALRQGLVSWDPQNTRWLHNLANSWHNDASIHYRNSKATETFTSARKGLQTFQKLILIEPDNRNWSDEMMDSLEIQRKRLQKLNHPDQALTLVQETTDFLEKLKAGNKDALTWNQTLAGLHRDVAKIDSEKIDPIAQHRLAAAAHAEEIGNDPQKQEALRRLAESYLDLGETLSSRKDSATAYAAARFVLTQLITTKSRRLKRLRDYAKRKEIHANGKLPQTLIAAGSQWKYLDQRKAPNADWITNPFDDSTWKEGPAPLGYGNGREATVISFGKHPDDKNLTAWFRQRFEIEDPSSIKTLQLNLRRDDGAIIYLNGKELLRSGMPDGEITPETISNNVSKGFDERVFHSYTLPISTLQKENIIAVEVHQNEPISSDLCFDLEIWNSEYLPQIPLDLKMLEALVGKEGIPEVLKTAL